MQQTDWRFYREGGHRYRIRAKFGIDYGFARHHHQDPYFSITGDIDRQARNNRWVEDSGGRIDEEIYRHFPSLRPFMKWNLVGPNGPMHYFENSKFWFEMVQGKHKQTPYEPDPIEGFRQSAVLGALPEDKTEFRGGVKDWSPRQMMPDFFEQPWSAVREWLEGRLPALRAAWVVDMGELGVLER